MSPEQLAELLQDAIETKVVKYVPNRFGPGERQETLKPSQLTLFKSRLRDVLYELPEYVTVNDILEALDDDSHD